MTAPIQPDRRVVPGTPAHRLIKGVLRVDTEPTHIARIDLLRTPAWTMSLADTGNDETSVQVPQGDCLIHVLWQSDEEDAAVNVDDKRFPIVPGDTMSVPAGSHLRYTSGMLLVEIESVSKSLDRVLTPNHGIETFEGYNRRTTYGSPAAFTFERWKITQPLIRPALRSPYAVVNLITPIAMSWPGGTDLIARGECRVIPPDTGPVTLLPDGLGYALLVR